MSERVTLTDEERDSLKDAGFDSFGANPGGLNELVESIVAERMADAWHEGWMSGLASAKAVVDGQRRLLIKNPYCDKATE